MVIDLGSLSFDNDFCFVSLEDGNVLAFNKINEDFLLDEEQSSIDKINIVLVEYKDEEVERQKVLSSVIGLDVNGNIKLTSLYPEQLGKILTEENRAFCTIEVINENSL